MIATAKKPKRKTREYQSMYGAPLTPRERDVAAGLLRARTNKEIAKELSIGYETVKEHVQHIMAKFGMQRREQVAVHMLREQLTADAVGQEFYENTRALIVDIEAKLAQLHVLLDEGLTRTSRKAGKK